MKTVSSSLTAAGSALALLGALASPATALPILHPHTVQASPLYQNGGDHGGGHDNGVGGYQGENHSSGGGNYHQGGGNYHRGGGDYHHGGGSYGGYSGGYYHHEGGNRDYHHGYSHGYYHHHHDGHLGLTIHL